MRSARERRPLWLALGLGLLTTPSCAPPPHDDGGSSSLPPIVLLSPETPHQDLPGSFSVLRDPQGTFTIDDVVGRARSGELRRSLTAEVSLGFTGDVYWVNLAVENARSLAGVWFLELSRALDYVDLYSRPP